MLVDLVIEDEVKLLDVGSGGVSVAKKFFPNATITQVDVDPDKKPDMVHDITEPFNEDYHGKFDIVFASHVLEHIKWKKVITTVENLAAVIREGGELWVIVPALEWAANEIAKDRPSPALMVCIYGGQDNLWDHHHCGFTLNLLRNVVAQSGLIPRQAYQGDFEITMDEKIYQARHNIVIGLKYGSEENDKELSK